MNLTSVFKYAFYINVGANGIIFFFHPLRRSQWGNDLQSSPAWKIFRLLIFCVPFFIFILILNKLSKDQAKEELETERKNKIRSEMMKKSLKERRR